MTTRCTLVALLGALALGGCKDQAAAPATETKPAETEPTETKPTETKPASPALAWETYTSADGKYSVELPGKAMVEDKGGMKIATAEFGRTATDDRRASCSATYFDYPAKPDDAKATLDTATKHLRKPDAKILEDKELTLGAHPGRAVIVENDKHRKWAHAFLVEARVYLVSCGGPFDRGDADGKVAMRVLDSFKLTN